MINTKVIINKAVKLPGIEFDSRVIQARLPYDKQARVSICCQTRDPRESLPSVLFDAIGKPVATTPIMKAMSVDLTP